MCTSVSPLEVGIAARSSYGLKNSCLCLHGSKINARAREGKIVKSWRQSLNLPLKRDQPLFIPVMLSFQILFDYFINLEWPNSPSSFLLLWGLPPLLPGRETRLDNLYVHLLLDNSNAQNVKLWVEEVSYMVLSVILLSSKLRYLLASKPIIKSLALALLVCSAVQQAWS